MRIWDILAMGLIVIIALSGRSWYGNDTQPPVGRRPAIGAIQSPSLPSLPGPTETSPVISISLEEKQQSSTGTAFSIDSSGTWITARHVADGCDKMALQKGYRKFVRIGRVWHHPNSDISVLKTSGGSPPFPGIQKDTSKGQHGYSFGFPKGKPGDVHGQIIGKRTMRVEGRYSTREPVLAWTQIQRVPDMGPHLGGISGGPWVNSAGKIIGVHVAGAPRRGRSYSATSESLLNFLQRIGIQKKGSSFATKKFKVNARDFSTVGNRLRQQLTIAKVFCLVGDRWR